MEIILLENVRNLGRLGDKVNVKPGYGRNYLIPRDMAVSATPENMEYFEERRAELEQKAQGVLGTAQKRAEQLVSVAPTIKVLASDEGKLYGSVGINEVRKALSEMGHDIKKHEIILPDGIIHTIGEYDIRLQLHSDVIVDMHISVVVGA